MGQSLSRVILLDLVSFRCTVMHLLGEEKIPHAALDIWEDPFDRQAASQPVCTCRQNQ